VTIFFNNTQKNKNEQSNDLDSIHIIAATSVHEVNTYDDQTEQKRSKLVAVIHLQSNNTCSINPHKHLYNVNIIHHNRKAKP